MNITLTCAVYKHALICDKVLQYVLVTVVDSICKGSRSEWTLQNSAQTINRIKLDTYWQTRSRQRDKINEQTILTSMRSSYKKESELLC